MAVRGAGEHVPEAVLVHESPGIDESLRRHVLTVLVVQLDLAAADDGVLERVEQPRACAFMLAPPRGADDDGTGRGLDIGPVGVG